jgi:hypothetical protein
MPFDVSDIVVLLEAGESKKWRDGKGSIHENVDKGRRQQTPNQQ